jgi:secreted trypsin-like serine protease
VVGGVRAAQGEFPWMVRLSMGCGGSLLTNQIVLTAGHCVGPTAANTTIIATLGVVDLDDSKAKRVRSTHVYRAPDYQSYERGSDWALVRLAEPVELPTLPIVQTAEHNRGLFTVMGWGADREGGQAQRWLLKAEVPDVDDTTCAAAYRATGLGFTEDAMLCAGLFGVGGVDTCQGDSGGPMVAKLADGAFVQVGIVSWGHGCAQALFPGVYTEVSTYAAMITKAAEILSQPPAPPAAPAPPSPTPPPSPPAAPAPPNPSPPSPTPPPSPNPAPAPTPDPTLPAPPQNPGPPANPSPGGPPVPPNAV